MRLNKDTIIVVLAVLSQLVGVTLWAANTTGRVEKLEIAQHEDRVAIEALTRESQRGAIQNAMIIERLESLKTSLNELKEQHRGKGLSDGKSAYTQKFEPTQGG